MTAKSSDALTFPAVPVSQHDTKLYCFVISAKTLYSLVRINQRDPDKQEGYQRALSASRVRAIANYIDKGHPIPTALLLALTNDVHYDSKAGMISIPERPDAGWVIDGQHRLAGAHEAESDVEFAVMAFVGLELREQIEQFVTINREAKGVPTSLYYDLLNDLPKKISDSHLAQERASDIAKELRTDEDSAFYGRITIHSPKKGELSLTNFVRKVSPLVAPKKGKFNLYSFIEQVGIIKNFYKALQIVFPKHLREPRPLFFSTIGFGALLNALPTIFDLSIKHFGGFRTDDVVKVLRKIEQFDFDSWQQLGTGNAAETQAGNDVRQELIDAFTTEDVSGSLKL